MVSSYNRCKNYKPTKSKKLKTFKSFSYHLFSRKARYYGSECCTKTCEPQAEK